jgi:broad specificity phosphatase PhoE
VHFDSLPEEKKKVINSLEYQPPNGENWTQARERAMEYLRELTPGHHLIYTHGGLMCSLTFNIGIKEVVPNCSVLSVEMCPQSKELSQVNFKWLYE